MNTNIINQVIILAIIMIVGVICRKKEILNSETNKRLSTLLVNVTLPCLILSSFNYKFTPQTINNAKLIFFYSIIIHLVFIFVSKLFYFKYDKESEKVLRFIAIFSNSSFMGYPVLQALYGSIGIFYAAIYGIPYNILVLSIGIMIYTEKRDKENLKAILKHPGIIATVIGMITLVTPLKIPVTINTALSCVGSMTTPLSMIIVGAMLAELNIKEVITGIAPYYCSLVRLIIMPIITYVLMRMLKANSMLLQICVLLEAMPAAVLSSILAEQCDADVILAAKCIFITTVLSIITIPLVVSCI